eukprot:IDg8349t1
MRFQQGSAEEAQNRYERNFNKRFRKVRNRPVKGGWFYIRRDCEKSEEGGVLPTLNPSGASYDKEGIYALAQRLALESIWDHFSHSAVAYWPTWPTQPRAERAP